MKYSCNYCNDQSGPCIVDVQCVDPEPPYSCIYANDEADMEAEWKPIEESKKDFEMTGICSDCSNCADNCSNCKDASCFSNSGAGRCEDHTIMGEKLRSEIDAANARLKVKDDSSKDPKSRYYYAGGLETLDIIKAKLTPDQYRGFLLGNIIKYSCRANHKGSFDRDIEKVKFYGAAIFDTLLPDERK